MSIETEPKPENPYEGWASEKLEAEKIKLESQIAEALDKIREREKIIAEGKEKNPRLKKELEELQKEREENEERGKLGEKSVAKLKQSLAKIKTKYFLEMTPKRSFFDPEFMRYVPGDKYMALMEGDRLNDDEKERATKARFKFCWDWFETKKYKTYKNNKDAYEEAFGRWLNTVEQEKDKDGNPVLRDKNGDHLKELDENGNEVMENGKPKLLQEEPKFEYDPEIRELFRNDIRNIKELILINNYIPDMFDKFDFVGHIRFPLIGEIRKNESFAGRGRNIREVKLEDFIEIIRHLEDRGIKKGDSEGYFKKFNQQQLEVLRKRMAGRYKGKERSEIAGMGSRTWKSPITIDLMDRTILQGFRVSDEEDKYIIVKHILSGFKAGGVGPQRKMSSQNEDALRWLISLKEGAVFYNVGEVAEELGIDIKKVANELGIKMFKDTVEDKKK